MILAPALLKTKNDEYLKKSYFARFLKTIMLTTFKDYFVELRLNRALSLKKHFQSRGVGKIQDVLLLLPEKANTTIVGKIARVLQIPKQAITTLTFVALPLQNEGSKTTFSKKDFDIFGGIADKELKAIVEKKYGLLVNLNTVFNSYLNCVTLRSKSVFKVGFATEEAMQIPDLLLSIPPQKIDLFCEEMKKYLDILQTKN